MAEAPDILADAVPIKPGSRDPLADAVPLSKGAFVDAGISPSEAAARTKEIEGSAEETAPDPLVENAVIAGVTGGMGLPLGMGWAPKTVAGKLLSIPLGTAEQTMYGWSAEKANQLVNPQGQHPIIGAAASLIAPMAAGGAESGIAGRLTNLRGLPASQEAAARTAANEAETALYEKAPEDIYKYGEAIQKANENVGTSMAAAVEKRAAEVGKAEKAATALARKEAAEKAKEFEAQSSKEMEGFLGRTPEEAAAARRMPFEDLAAHRANMRNVVFGPAERIGEQLGKQFDVATQDRLEEEVGSIEPLAKAVASENSWLSEHGRVASKPIRDLIEAMPVAEADEAIRAQIPDLFKGKGDPQAQARFYKYIEDYGKAHPEAVERHGIPRETYMDFAIRALGGASASKPTIGQLMGWRTGASKLVASQTGHNQAVAMQIRDAIDQTLMDAGVNVPPALREQWGTYKALFDSKFRRNVATAPNPLGYGKSLFESSPERSLTIIRNATPDERNSLKQLFADYVYSKNWTPKQLGKRMNPDVLKELFGDTPYAKFQPWMDTPKMAAAWESARAGDPDISRLARAGFQNEIQAITEERAADVRKAGIELARKLGPAGRGKLAKILSTRDPIAAARIVEQEFPISPQGAQELYRQSQLTPGKKAFDAVREAKAIQGGLDISATREAAAVQALMKQPGNATMAMYKRRLYAWHLPMLLAGAASGAIGGHSIGGTYQAGISGMIMGMMAAEKVRDMLRPALTDPEAARAYWQAIEMKPSALTARRHGALLARVLAALIADKMAGNEKQEQPEEALP